MDKSEMILTYHKPAQVWSEALPLGNGRMGAMVYGGQTEEVFDLSEGTFFSGNPSPEDVRPNGPQTLRHVRQLLVEKRYDEAQAAAAELTGQKGNYGTNLPVGRLRIQFLSEGAKAEEYERSLNFGEGVFRCREVHRGRTIERTAFLSQPDQVLVCQFESDPGIPLNFQVTFEELGNPGISVAAGDNLAIRVQALETLHSDGTTGASLWGRLLRRDSDDGLKSNFYWAMATDFADSDPEATVKARLTRASQTGFDALLIGHSQDIRSKMERVGLRLGALSTNGADTAVRIERIHAGSPDPSLAAMAFQYGRYLLLCSSREDSLLPAHLQGAWNENTACRILWTCDFHLDINTQMNYWPAEITNLPETLPPLFRWLSETLVRSGRTTAKKLYGLDGWVAHLSSNAWGFSAPGWDAWWGIHPTGGAWLATHLWNHYLYSGDADFLRKVALPVYEGAVAFFLDYLVPDRNTGWLLSGPSMSPENAFKTAGGACTLSMGCTADAIIVREIFTGFLAMIEALKTSHPLSRRVAEALPQLPPFQTGSLGQLREWLEDFEEADPYHRHTSHLLSVYPFHQIDVERTPEWAKAAQVSLQRKTTPPEKWEDTGWARSLLILYEARFRDAERAGGHVNDMLALLSYPNLMIRHPPVAGAHSSVFELDGNTGLTTGIAEMLLQSGLGQIRLLPAVPQAWSSGEFDGLRAQGGWTVSCRWEDGRPIKTGLCPDTDAGVEVIWNGRSQKVQGEAGKWIQLDVLPGFRG